MSCHHRGDSLPQVFPTIESDALVVRLRNLRPENRNATAPSPSGWAEWPALRRVPAQDSWAAAGRDPLAQVKGAESLRVVAGRQGASRACGAGAHRAAASQAAEGLRADGGRSAGPCDQTCAVGFGVLSRFPRCD